MHFENCEKLTVGRMENGNNVSKKFNVQLTDD